MATGAIPGLHAKFLYYDGASYVEMGEITNIDWEGPTREAIEISNLNTEDEYVNRIQGVLNAGPVTLSMNYTFTGWAVIIDHIETRGKKFYRIQLPDGAGLEWEGFITEAPLGLPTDAQMAGDIVIVSDGRVDLISGGESTGLGAS